MKKILLLLFITFLGIILAVFACFILFEDIQENSKDYVARRTAIANIEANFENQKNLKNVFRDHELNFKKFENLFVEQDAPIEFFEFLEDTAEHCSLSIDISSSSVKEPEEGENKYLNLQIQLKGDEQNFLRFLEQIENSDYFIEVTSLNLSKVNKGTAGMITAILTIKTPVK